MFEAVALGHKVDKSTYEKDEVLLRQRLLEAQRALQVQKFQTLVIVSGVEGAGKSAVVNRLREWLDARGVQVTAFWDTSDEESQRPAHYRYWRAMPKGGTIGIFFGSWYTPPIVNRVFGEAKRSEVEAELERINAIERTLTDSGVLLVKLWLHIEKDVQKERLGKRSKRSSSANPFEKRFAKHYDDFASVSETVIRHTDTGHAPWQLVDAEDPRYRDLKTGHLLLEALERRLEESAPPSRPARDLQVEVPGERCTVLDAVDLSSSIEQKKYEKRLKELQTELFDLAWQARAQRRSLVALFEGWDAAGKGGAIRRVTQAIDARMLDVIPIAAPTDEERAQHYLWRFWRHVPRKGTFAIFDRSWYGRVLVERVEGFASENEWRRAYQEINDFEHQLVTSDIVLVKFWLHISKDEQLSRFKDREGTPHKRYKITPDDWRNREKWTSYEDAVDEMVRRTSTRYAPWTLVPSNDKRFARVHVVETLVTRLREALVEKAK